MPCPRGFFSLLLLPYVIPAMREKHPRIIQCSVQFPLIHLLRHAFGGMSMILEIEPEVHVFFLGWGIRLYLAVSRGCYWLFAQGSLVVMLQGQKSGCNHAQEAAENSFCRIGNS